MDLARTFLALDPDDALRERLAALGPRLRERFPPSAVRWTPPANYHFTLVFLGRIAAGDVARVQHCATRVAASLAPFRYVLREVRAFPAARAPRVIAALPSDAAAFLAWQQALAAALAADGFAMERRPYRPHLSLGRWRSRAACPEGDEFVLDLEGRASEVRLYESREGRYWPLFTLRCGGGETGV